ncbi:MAG: ABC transporter permease, partial [Christensenellaceae bacterium]|nr:ABC transporter permease [Christensenellaceae bacterium]
CAYIYRWFPLIPSMPRFEFSFNWVRGVVYNAFMPAISLMLVGTGWWIISMKSLSSGVAEEDFVAYGRLKGLSEATIGYRYVFRNSILSQVTALALQIGGLFSGSLMCEIIFDYPGVGQLISTSIYSADYNLLIGLITISIIAVATATLIIDMIYPFLDPRIRYK